jgi:hypothetical protein
MKFLRYDLQPNFFSSGVIILAELAEESWVTCLTTVLMILAAAIHVIYSKLFDKFTSLPPLSP